MAEVGCLKDGHFQNLSCEGNIILDGGAVHTGASTLQDVRVSGILSLGPDPQTEGVFSAKIDTGLVNGPTIFTIPDPGNGSTNSAVGDPASPIADGPITMTKELFSKGYIIGAAEHDALGGGSAVIMPNRGVFRDIFGPNRKAGDSFIYRIQNNAPANGKLLRWTATAGTGATLVGESDISTNIIGFRSVGTFMCRLVSDGVDADTVHYRLS